LAEVACTPWQGRGNGEVTIVEKKVKSIIPMGGLYEKVAAIIDLIHSSDSLCASLAPCTNLNQSRI
jgi:hypothetical protein